MKEAIKYSPVAIENTPVEVKYSSVVVENATVVIKYSPVAIENTPDAVAGGSVTVAGVQATSTDLFSKWSFNLILITI